MGMMLRPRRRGMEAVRRRLDMGLRRKWAMRRRGGIEERKVRVGGGIGHGQVMELG